jgi:hypothetical protein
VVAAVQLNHLQHKTTVKMVGLELSFLDIQTTDQL